LRLAITLLIQQPKLAEYIHEPLPLLEIPGAALLSELIDIIKNNAVLTTGDLLENFRERKESKLLAKMAHTEHMIPPLGIEKEFLGALQKLRQLAHKQIIDRLLAKAAQGKLSLEEKQYLHELINNKGIYAE
jgi:DNA primase